MRWLLLCLLLTGCTVVNVSVTPTECKVDYYTALRDATAIDYSICGGSAIVKKTESQKVPLQELLRLKMGK
jgi:hypothetical protein